MTDKQIAVKVDMLASTLSCQQRLLTVSELPWLIASKELKVTKNNTF